MSCSRFEAFPGTMRGVAMVGITGAALAMLGGCTTQLRSVHLQQDAVAPRAGVPYNLTFTQFNVTLERSISKCLDDKGQTDIEIASDFTFSSSEARDPSHEYALDMTSLRSFFKTTDVSVSYHPNGALASINAKASDQTGTFITSVASTVGKVLVTNAAPSPASMSNNFSAQAVPSKDVQSVPGCTDATKKALKELPTYTEQLGVATQELNYAIADFASITKMAEISASRGREGWKQEVKAAFDNFKAKRQSVEEAQKQVNAARKQLAFETKKVTWPPAGDIKLSVGAVFQAITEDEFKASKKLTTGTTLSETEGNRDYWLEVKGLTVGWTGAEDKATGSSPTVEGVRYRKAMPGRLMVSSCPSGVKEKVATCTGAASSALQPITQLGPIFALPLKNYPFMTQSITAEFNDAGQPVKIGYFSEATAGKIGDTLDGVTEQWLKVKEARKPKSELDTVNEQLALLQAQNQLSAAKQAQANAADPDLKATEAAKAKAALLEAQLAQLKAEKALLEAQRGSN